MFEVAFWLLVGHAVGDFALQSDWMAIYKSRHNKDVKVLSNAPGLIWIHVLGSHCSVHAGAVALATGSIVLGILEFIAHFAIDFCKSEGWFGFHTDQFLHLGCKALWLVLLFATPLGSL
ncbi:MAG: DUF3307 domain-containing protein [Oceanococcaceae bacterium]